jgi:hypothetical protein
MEVICHSCRKTACQDQASATIVARSERSGNQASNSQALLESATNMGGSLIKLAQVELALISLSIPQGKGAAPSQDSDARERGPASPIAAVNESRKLLQ